MLGISKRFGGVHALNDVSFSLRRGEVQAMIGENGAGKSTLIKVLSGAVKPDKGEVFLEGRQLKLGDPKESLKAGIRTVYQEMSLIPQLDVAMLVEILHMVKEADLVLDLCHSGTRERFIILEEANKIGLKRIMLTHPNWNVNKASADQQAEMAKMGAYVLLHYYTSVPHFNNPNCDPWEMMEIIEKVGVDKVIVATDGGSVINTNPVEIMRVFIKILLAMKVSPEDIKRMIRTNPAKLLGLEE